MPSYTTISASLRHRAGDLSGARDAFARALTLDPSLAEAQSNLTASTRALGTA